MGFLRLFGAFVVAVAVTFTAASFFYTQQVLAKQAKIGAEYTQAQTTDIYLMNLAGLAPAFGAVLAIALLLGFGVAAVVKRILRPLALVAFPVAGAASVLAAIYLIEMLMAPGGAGVIGGARDGVGLALQGLAGALGGIVFALLRGGPRTA